MTTTTTMTIVVCEEILPLLLPWQSQPWRNLWG
jgi:hypothetical protein